MSPSRWTSPGTTSTSASGSSAPAGSPHGNIAFLGKRGRLYWDPLGVIAIISPWNYPLLLPFGELIPALLAGNAVLLKPSEFTTRTALLGVELLHRGWAAGRRSARCWLAAGEVGAALIEAGPDKIFFTGSVRTGRKVAAAPRPSG